MSETSKPLKPLDEIVAILIEAGYSVGKCTCRNGPYYWEAEAVIYPDGRIDDIEDNEDNCYFHYIDLEQQWRRAWIKFETGDKTGQRWPDYP